MAKIDPSMEADWSGPHRNLNQFRQERQKLAQGDSPVESMISSKYRRDDRTHLFRSAITHERPRDRPVNVLI